jgi:GT2 family glycosyltransferase
MATESDPVPEVSVVIPTRDRPGWLERSVSSAVEQVEVSLEVIVVDDGSRPPMPDRWPSVRLLRNERSEGVAAARNAGVSAARGEWLAFLDDDDLWAPEKLRLQIDAANRASADMAFAGGLCVDAHGRPLRVVEAPPAGPHLEPALLAANVIPFTCSNLIARTALVRQIGAFDTQLVHLADWDIALRLSRVAKAASVPHLLVAYTLHGANMQTDERGLEVELERFARKHASARAAAGAVLDEPSWLRWRISARRLAGDVRGAARASWRLGRTQGDLGMLLRAVVLGVGGERAMRLGRRLRSSQVAPQDIPEWLVRQQIR